MGHPYLGLKPEASDASLSASVYGHAVFKFVVDTDATPLVSRGTLNL